MPKTLSRGAVRCPQIIKWNHGRMNGEAHCLARVLSTQSRTVVILSELYTNDNKMPIFADFPGAANAAFRQFLEGEDGNPDEITWIEHLGAFSYVESTGPDVFRIVDLHWVAEECVGGKAGEWLDFEKIQKEVGELDLEPVINVLKSLQS